MRHRTSALLGASLCAVLVGAGCSVSANSNLTQDVATPTGGPVVAPPETTRPVPAASPSWTPSPGDKTVYLTFDDGPWFQTEQILDVLKENDVKATFFQIGKMIRTREATNKRIWHEGHAIGNHTWDHIDLAPLTDAQVRYQLEMTQGKIGPRAGYCMRPPYGSLDSSSRAVARELGLTPVLWSVDTNDWSNPNESSIYQRLLTVKPGDVVLMHDGGGDRTSTLEALRKALPQLKDRGYTFGVVPVCLNPNAAE